MLVGVVGECVCCLCCCLRVGVIYMCAFVSFSCICFVIVAVMCDCCFCCCLWSLFVCFCCLCHALLLVSYCVLCVVV